MEEANTLSMRVQNTTNNQEMMKIVGICSISSCHVQWNLRSKSSNSAKKETPK